MSIGKSGIEATQARALEALLLEQLPPAPARVLLVGHGAVLHTTKLAGLGYQVSECSYCLSQELVQPSSAARQPIGAVNLVVPGATAESFAAALVLDVTTEVHPLALWDQLAHWLTGDALVVMAGQQQAGQMPRMPRWLEYVSAIGARCGFVESNLSQAVASGCEDAFIRIFRKSGSPRWQLRHVRPQDFDQIARLFQGVFGHPMSRDLWNWKYGNGHGNAVVAARNGALIAHYGGMYRDVMLCGKPDWVFQICDVMVHPNERGVMTRQGPFLLTAATSAEIYGPLGFGFPNERAMQVAAKMGLYAEVGQMAEVRWVPASTGFRLRTRLQPVLRDSAVSQSLVEALWTAMANDLQHDVVGVRDWKFVEHRYFNHPHNHYEVLAVTSRLAGRPRGVIVLRRLEAMCELVDVIAPLANLPLLIDQARRLTGLWGLPYLYCWITKNHLSRFLAIEGEEVALNVSIPTSCWTDDPRANVFKDRWWLMSGDTDFR